jgi:predicted nucleotidyltransferase
MEHTKEIADTIVNKLQNALAKFSLPSMKCIYISGSYCRGDFLNNSSDLDVNFIFSDNNGTKDNDLKTINNIVEKAKGTKILYSHCPGGIDYGYNEYSYIPKSLIEASKPNPYPYFSTLMFDLKKYHKTIYGEELSKLLPDTPDPKKTVKDWLIVLIDRARKIDKNDIKIQFVMYKIILALQLLFGEISINKYNILHLYEKNVPGFKMKWFGEMVIRNYIGSIYPERPVIMYEYELYANFMNQVIQLVNK